MRDPLTSFSGYALRRAANATAAELSARLELSEGALKVTVHRMRQRFRALLREEVARTVASAAEIDEELRHLVGIVRRSVL